MQWVVPFCLLAASLALAGCRDASRDGYVALTGHIFVFNPRVASATYVVTLGKLKPIPDGATVVAEFENPAGGAPHVVVQPVYPKLEKIALESPQLSCLKKDRRYAFSLSLKGPDGTELQAISSSVLSTLDQSIMPDAPLVIGPEYQPNPALKGDPAGKIAGLKKPDCPA